MMSYLQVRRDATRSDKKVKFIAEQQTLFFSYLCLKHTLFFPSLNRIVDSNIDD